jgi:hypothetical protein
LRTKSKPEDAEEAEKIPRTPRGDAEDSEQRGDGFVPRLRWFADNEWEAGIDAAWSSGYRPGGTAEEGAEVAEDGILTRRPLRAHKHKAG